jgi:hypothetical protein
MKKFQFLFLAIFIVILSGCNISTNYSNTSFDTTNIETTTSQYSNYVIVKYRTDTVDVANFDTVNTFKSSFIR